MIALSMDGKASRAHGLEIDRLAELSARIGRDPLLVQASTGNTSLKLGGLLWIKASGKWLASATHEDMFVPVDLPQCLERMRQAAPLPPGVLSEGSRLRPSIETFMHAILPHRVVVHLHSINTISWAVRQDGPCRLAERLQGLRWKWIPYITSGLPLARAIESACSAEPSTDVLVLGNHGLVVCGDDCDQTEDLLMQVERRLRIERRTSPEPRLSSCDQRDWRMPVDPPIHALGTDSVSRQIAGQGVLYPCQAIFLGPMLPYASASDSCAPYKVIPDSGVLIRENITAAAYAVLSGFIEVLQRMDTQAPVRYLTADEVETLMGSAVQQYRMSAENQAPL